MELKQQVAMISLQRMQKEYGVIYTCKEKDDGETAHRQGFMLMNVLLAYVKERKLAGAKKIERLLENIAQAINFIRKKGCEMTNKENEELTVYQHGKFEDEGSYTRLKMKATCEEHMVYMIAVIIWELAGRKIKEVENIIYFMCQTLEMAKDVDFSFEETEKDRELNEMREKYNEMEEKED